MDEQFETKFRIIKKLVILTGQQAKMLADRRDKISDTLNLYHNLAVDYSILTANYFSDAKTKTENTFEKIKTTLLRINPDYSVYLEKI